MTPLDVPSLVSSVASRLHAGDRVGAARECLAAFGRDPSAIQRPEDAEPQLQTLLRKLLDSRQLALAAELLWPPSMFTPRPRSVRLIWENVQKYPFVLLPGASSMGKSYTPGVALLLEWLCDPEFTQVVTVGPSEEHLESNLFTHLVTLHAEASIKLPGSVNKLFIGLDPRRRKSSISGRVIPVGTKAAGRLQGMKRTPRPKPHPLYGRMTRLFLLIDELENVPSGIYADLDNLVSNHIEGDDGFKIIGSYNPKDRALEPGRLSEPVFGWDKFDVDLHEVWDSKRGWRVVRLDAEKTENIIERRIVFPGLQSHSALERLAISSGGRDSAGYYTFGRGAYPPSSSSAVTVVTQGSLDSRRGVPQFVASPTPIAGSDLALDGGDAAKFAFGLTGFANQVKMADGSVLKFPERRRVLYLKAIHTLPKGDTVDMSVSVRELCIKLRVVPALLCLDSTGHTRGVSDVLKKTFGQHIPVNNSESPTDLKITESDPFPASEVYDRVASELWFALQAWIEYDCLFIDPDFDLTDLAEQIYGRRYAPGKTTKVEHKKDFKIRNRGRSPDDADAVTLLVHAVRKAFSAVLMGVPGEPRGLAKFQIGNQQGLEQGGAVSYCDPTNDLTRDSLD